MDLITYLRRRQATRLTEDQLSLRQTGKTLTERRAEQAESEDERFIRAWCATHRMPGQDIEAYVRMGIDERARWRRDNPQKMAHQQDRPGAGDVPLRGAAAARATLTARRQRFRPVKMRPEPG